MFLIAFGLWTVLYFASRLVCCAIIDIIYMYLLISFLVVILHAGYVPHGLLRYVLSYPRIYIIVNTHHCLACLARGKDQAATPL